jgi:hypothetical protein
VSNLWGANNKRYQNATKMLPKCYQNAKNRDIKANNISAFSTSEHFLPLLA